MMRISITASTMHPVGLGVANVVHPDPPLEMSACEPNGSKYQPTDKASNQSRVTAGSSHNHAFKALFSEHLSGCYSAAWL